MISVYIICCLPWAILTAGILILMVAALFFSFFPFQSRDIYTGFLIRREFYRNSHSSTTHLFFFLFSRKRKNKKEDNNVPARSKVTSSLSPPSSFHYIALFSLSLIWQKVRMCAHSLSLSSSTNEETQLSSDRQLLQVLDLMVMPVHNSPAHCVFYFIPK